MASALVIVPGSQPTLASARCGNVQLPISEKPKESNDQSLGLNQPFLLDMNLTLKDFVLPEHLRYDTPHDKFADDEVLPLIDMAFCEDSESRQDIAAKMASAAETWGFFQVVNHGVPLEVMDRNVAQATSLFGKPMKEKLEVQGAPGAFDGYKDGSKYGQSWSESVNFHWAREKVDVLAHKAWPEDEHKAEEMSADLNEYLDHMDTLSRQLLELLSEGLGLPSTRISQYYSRDSASSFRWNHYPACDRPDLAAGIGPHTDPHTLAILHQDSVGGLQLLKDGEWMGVQPIPGALVVNIGDALQAWSNGRYQSVMHRAVLNSTQSRLTVVFFLCQNDDALVGPIPELTDETHPAKYRPFTLAQYRMITIEDSKRFLIDDVRTRPHRLNNVAI